MGDLTMYVTWQIALWKMGAFAWYDCSTPMLFCGRAKGTTMFWVFNCVDLKVVSFVLLYPILFP